MMRPTNEHDRRRLKSVCRAALNAAGGPTVMETVTRTGKSNLSLGTSLDNDIHYLPLDVVADLAGYRLVPNTDGPVGEVHDIIAAMGRTAREAGEACGAVASALADGAITPRERSDIRREIAEAMAALMTLDRAVGGEGA